MSSINPYVSPSDVTFEVQNVRWPIEVPGQLSRDDFVDSTKAFAAFQARILFWMTFILAAFFLSLRFFNTGEIDFVMIPVVAVLCCICPASVILAARFGVNSGYRKFQECIPDLWRIYPNRIDLVEADSGSGCIPSRIIFTQTTATIITALRQRIIIPRRAFRTQESWHQFVEHTHGRLPLVENNASTADAASAETADLMLESKYSLAQANHLYCVCKKYMKIRLERYIGLLFSGLALFMLLTFTLTGRPSSITPMLLMYGIPVILLMLGIRITLVLSAQSMFRWGLSTDSITVFGKLQNVTRSWQNLASVSESRHGLELYFEWPLDVVLLPTSVVTPEVRDYVKRQNFKSRIKD